jgi:hypothetical protein
MDAAKIELKTKFEEALRKFVEGLKSYSTSEDGQWTVKGFIDAFKNVYTISSDTKIVSKILEIHLFPKILEFASENGFKIVPADHQNYYPDISFVGADDDSIRFAVDFKTTYRLPTHAGFCNGFTLGSHGEYFINRQSTKNIQFPYSTYLGHFCLGIIYTRAFDRAVDETKIYGLDDLKSIVSVVKDFDFFVAEKWRIASDRSGSGNTANIGSIDCIADIVAGRGMFADLGEDVFDDYWMNYGKITTVDKETGVEKHIRNLPDFLKFRGLNGEGIVARAKRVRNVNSEVAEDEG